MKGFDNRSSFTVIFSQIAHLIELSLKGPSAKTVVTLCGEWYQPYYQFMWFLATRINWGILVELGVEKGRGVGCLASATNLETIGFDNNLQNEAIRVASQHNNLQVFELPSLPVPEIITNRGKCISLLHIDTEHSYSMAKAEFEQYEPHLLDNAVVLFDDLHAQDNDVLKFFSELSYPKIQDDRLHPVNGYGVMLYV